MSLRRSARKCFDRGPRPQHKDARDVRHGHPYPAIEEAGSIIQVPGTASVVRAPVLPLAISPSEALARCL